MSNEAVNDLLERLEQLTSIGIALSAEKEADRLQEKILLGAKEITNADGGTLYTVIDNSLLQFEIIRSDSLNFAMGGTSGRNIPFDPIPLHEANGAPNLKMVAAYAVLNDRTVNIPDAYTADGFDFSGTREFDNKTGYRSTSFLTIPMKNHENDIIGVLQLINAKDRKTGEIIPFSGNSQRLAESMASQAAIAMTNSMLISELEALFEAMIQLIATAIDDKSPYTGGHCRRVPELTLLIADAVDKANYGPMKGFKLTDKDIYELKIAAWLHDCGKIITPENVVDKSTKLECIYDRIETVNTRIESLKKDLEIDLLHKKIGILEKRLSDNNSDLESEHKQKLAALEDDRIFLHKANIGGEFMSDEARQRVTELGQKTFNSNGKKEQLLTKDEIYNLCIPKGTLTDEERQVINHHIVATIKMLESLPFPKHLSNVAEYAGGHHERMNGKGYPKGLTKEQMSVQARMMGIADIFEALTARDRPYKKGMLLSDALRIMGKMRQDNHIDGDLFDIFIKEKVYLGYATKFLEQEQIDDILHEEIPGYGA